MPAVEGAEDRGQRPAVQGGEDVKPAVCGEEGPINRAVRAGTHTVGHDSAATFDGPRESVLENRGNVQSEYPLRGILAL